MVTFLRAAGRGSAPGWTWCTHGESGGGAASRGTFLARRASARAAVELRSADETDAGARAPSPVPPHADRTDERFPRARRRRPCRSRRVRRFPSLHYWADERKSCPIVWSGRAFGGRRALSLAATRFPANVSPTTFRRCVIAPFDLPLFGHANFVRPLNIYIYIYIHIYTQSNRCQHRMGLRGAVPRRFLQSP